MKRHTAENIDLQDHDSFLDIVANMVGILIILVMVVGIKAKGAIEAAASSQMPPPEALAVSSDSLAELHLLRGKAVSLQREVLETDHGAKTIFAAIQQREAERNYLANQLAAVEAALADRGAELDEQARQVYQARLALEQSQSQLAAISEQLVALELMPKQVTQVESLPTPLARTVHGREVHFQLQGGRLAYVPVEELFEEAKREAREKVWKLEQGLEATELVGPSNGFRMRYTLEKAELPLEVRKETGRTGYVIRSKSWELIPTSSRLGQPLAEAMQPDSDFNRLMKSLDPADATVTVWIYPDSFSEFRELKKHLFARGFATAGRPLPEGVSIGGSPNGTRSNAQ